MRKIGLWRSLLLGLVMAAGILSVNRLDTRAAAMPEMKSKGKIAWDNGTPSDKSDDITVFDAKDIQYLYDLADPNNDTLWRQEESGIRSGDIYVYKEPTKDVAIPMLYLTSDVLKNVEDYIKSVRKAYSEGGKTSFSHYAYSDYLTNGKIKGEKDSYTSAKNGTLMICYTDLSGHYELNNPVRRSDNIAINSGFVRLTSSSSTTGKIMNLGWADYYDSETPNLIYTTALDCNFATDKETLYTYTDINYKDIRAQKKNIPSFDLHYNLVNILPGKDLLGLNGTDVQEILDYVKSTYISEQTAGSNYNSTNKLVKIGKLTLPPTAISELPKSKETKRNSDLREVVISGNISAFPDYQKLSAADLLLTTTSFDYEIGDRNKSFFKFPIQSKAAAKDDTSFITYNNSTGDVSFTFLIETKKNQNVSGFTLDGEFDIYASFTPSDYTELGSYTDTDDPDVPGIYDGFGNRIYTWDEMLAKGLDINGVDSCQKNLSSILNEDNIVSTIRVKVPSSVKALGYGPFQNLKYISSASFEEGVNSIGDYAFSGCTMMKFLSFPDSITKIGQSSFSLTGITSVVLPSNVEDIGYCAFYNCTNLHEIDLSSLSITSIGDYLFKNSAPTSILFPESLETLGKEAFKSSSTSSTSYKCAEVHIPDSIKTIGNGCFSSGSFSDTTFYFGKNFNGDAMGSDWRYGSSKVVLEDGITRVGNYLLANYDEPITIPSSVRELGERTCWYASGEITLNEGLEIIGEDSFFGYRGGYVEIPSTVHEMGSGVFYNAEHPVVVFKNNPTALPDHFFYDCGYTSFDGLIPESVQKLGDDCFAWNNFSEAIIPDTVLEVESGLFAKCKELERVVFPDSVECYDNSQMFDNCTSLKEVVNFPLAKKTLTYRDGTKETYLEIGMLCFGHCSSLETITIDKEVNRLDNGCFSECTSLKEVVFELPSQLNQINIHAFSNCTELEIEVPNTVKTIDVSKTNIDLMPFYNVKSLIYRGSSTGAPWGAKMYNGVPQ